MCGAGVLCFSEVPQLHRTFPSSQEQRGPVPSGEAVSHRVKADTGGNWMLPRENGCFEGVDEFKGDPG